MTVSESVAAMAGTHGRAITAHIRVRREMPQTVHVMPVGDLIEHLDEECPCGPVLEPVFDADGACGWLITHHSLDGRELTE